MASTATWNNIHPNYCWPRDSSSDDESYVMHGRFSNLPPSPSKLVRIFLSSTFTDTYTERNLLIQNVYPKLQKLCKEKYDLDFQVVDMRWGVRNEATVDHSASALCMKEIQKCKEHSIGPTFVALLSHRYGGRPLPNVISQGEMNHIAEEIRLWSSHQEDLDVLAKWYKLDQNAKPHEYVLQPIIDNTEIEKFLQEPERLTNKYDYLYRSYLPKTKNDTSESSESKKEAYRRLVQDGGAVWKKDEPELTRILRAAVGKCVGNGRMSEIQKRKFFQSVTAEEIQRGLIDDPERNDRCLVFRRTIKDINLTHAKASRFIDQHDDGSVDREAQDLLETLTNVDIPASLPPENIFDFTTLWHDDEGINEKDHMEYLKAFCDTFEKSVLKLIEKAVREKTRSVGYPLFSEVLEHSHHCIQKVERFHGREDELNRIRDYVMSSSDQPFIVHGESVCGKTSVMARAAIQVPDWLGDSMDICTVIRFLGTTPQSSSIFKVLYSVTNQILSLAHLHHKYPHLPQEFADLKDTFKEILSSVTTPKQIVIFLDSLDQLSDQNDLYKLLWLPKRLPQCIKMIVSTLSEEKSYMLRTLTSSAMNLRETQFLKIEPLNPHTSQQVLKLWLGKKNRQLTREQENIVNELIKKDAQPLYLKLVFDEISTWKSFETPAFKCPTMGSCLHRLFKKLEIRHGDVLVQRALGYLCASKNGLTETEMEDILSLDEEVLNDVFEFHVPPIRRLPSILWSRIRGDLKEYIVHRDADGTNVLAWYHRQFVQEACKRYVPGLSDFSHNPTRNKENLPLYVTLAEYFAGMWAGKTSKPFLYTDRQCKKLKLPSPEATELRYVREQPSIYVPENGSIDIENIKYNRRKVSELPHACEKVAHNADNITFIAQHIAFNPEFLMAWISLSSMEEISDVLRTVSLLRPFKTRDLMETLRAQILDENDPETTKNTSQENMDTVSHWEQLAGGSQGCQLQISSVLHGLLLSYGNLVKNPTYVGADLTGRLLHYSEHLYGIHSLVKHTDGKGRLMCALVPPHLNLESPGSELLYEISNHIGPVLDSAWSEANGHLCVSVSKKFKVASLKDGAILIDTKPVTLPEDDYFRKVTTIVSKAYKPVYLASLASHPHIYAFDEDGEILTVIDMSKLTRHDITISDMKWFYSIGKENEACVVVLDKSKNGIFYLSDVLEESVKCTEVGDINSGKVISVFINKHYAGGKVLVLKESKTWELYDELGTLLDKTHFVWDEIQAVNEDPISHSKVTGILVGFGNGQICTFDWLLESADLRTFVPQYLFRMEDFEAGATPYGTPYYLYQQHPDETDDSLEQREPISLGLSCSNSHMLVFGETEQILKGERNEQNSNSETIEKFDKSLKLICHVKAKFNMAVFTEQMNFIIAAQGGVVHIMKVNGLTDLPDGRLTVDHFATIHAHREDITKILLANQETLFMTSSKDSSLKFYMMDRIGKTRKYLPQFDHTETVIKEILAGDRTAITFSEHSKLIYQWDLLHGKVRRILHNPAGKTFIKCTTDSKLEHLAALDENGVCHRWKLDGYNKSQVRSTGSLAENNKATHTDSTAAQTENLEPFPQFSTDVDLASVSFKDIFMCMPVPGTVVVAFRGQPAVYVFYITEEGTPATEEMLGISDPLLHALKLKDHRVLFISESTCYVVNCMGRNIEYKYPLRDILVAPADLLDVCCVESADQVVFATADKMVFWKPTDGPDTIPIIHLDGIQRVGKMDIFSSQTSTLVVVDTEAKSYFPVDATSQEMSSRRLVSKPQHPMQHVVLTPDGHYLVYVSGDTELHLVRVSDGRLLARYTMYDTVQSLSVSSDGWYVLIGTSDRRLFVLLIADPLNESHDGRIKSVREVNPKYSKQDVLALIGDMNNYLTEADDSFIANAAACLESKFQVVYPSDSSDDNWDDEASGVLYGQVEGQYVEDIVEGSAGLQYSPSDVVQLYTTVPCSVQ